MSDIATFDHLIIGGGIIGLTIARELHRRGERSIAVVDQSTIGTEASWAAAGMLAPNIEAQRTSAFCRICNDSLALYPAFISELQAETDVRVELNTNGIICLSFNEDPPASVESGQPLSSDAIRHLEPHISPNVRDGILFPNEGHVNNRALLNALRRYAELNNIRIIENTQTSEILSDNGRAQGAAGPATSFRSATTIVATGAWSSLITISGQHLPFQIKPVKGQMIALNSSGIDLSHVIYSPRGYLVPRSADRILVGATVENTGFDKSSTPDAAREIHAAAAEIIPDLAHVKIVDQWAGLRPHAPNGTPIIGPVPDVENLYLAAGHFRNGILLAPLTAAYIADDVQGKTPGSERSRFLPERTSQAKTVNI
ncbi:MAG: glycine oxidase ThiO [Blastocatellia bacterium]|nr:glycine oxidase ThiO [Blastocatellia bacterium]